MSAIPSPTVSFPHHINWHPHLALVPGVLTNIFNTLASTILISGTFAFVLSLPLSLLLGIPLDPVALTEALPFLVITVGFDKPLRIARAVFAHPSFTPVSGMSTPKTVSTNGTRRGSLLSPSLKSSPSKSAAEVVREAVDSVGPGVVRDYAIEIAVLGVGAASGVGGLKEFCALAALILACDCAALFTFYVAILNVMTEVSLYVRGAFTVVASFHSPRRPPRDAREPSVVDISPHRLTVSKPCAALSERPSQHRRSRCLCRNASRPRCLVKRVRTQRGLRVRPHA